MSERFDADVAIVGYGPSGLIAALTLAKHGISAIAFERYEEIYARARAVTVNDWTVRIFQDLGVDQAVLPTMDPQRALRWMTYAGEEVMRIDHPPSTLGVTPRFYNIYQPVMERQLRDCALEYPELLDVRYGSEVLSIDQDDDAIAVTARDESTGQDTTVRTRYALCCDGGSSGMRDALGISMLGETETVEWIVIDCRVKRWWPNRNLLTFWSDQERPVVDIALSLGNHRWEIPLKPGESPADFPTQEEVWPLMEAIGVSKDDVEIHQYAFYHHHVRMAERWRENRAFLVGDAAHLMPPWAGAGMQTGMRDAHDIGWKLARVLKGQSSPSLLDTYETERRPNAQMYTDLAVSLGKVIKQEATEADMKRLDPPPSEDPRRPAEPPLIAAPRLTDGWFRGPIDEASIVGRMIPQPVVGDNHGAMARLDELLGNDYILLGHGVNPETFLTDEEKAAWDALGARYMVLRSQDEYTQGPDEIIDLDEVLGPWMGAYDTQAIALRPDKFVAASSVSGLGVPG